jgi:hypothetical protein
VDGIVPGVEPFQNNLLRIETVKLDSRYYVERAADRGVPQPLDEAKLAARSPSTPVDQGVAEHNSSFERCVLRKVGREPDYGALSTIFFRCHQTYR